MRCRPIVFAFVSAPIDTPTLSPFLIRCPCSQSSVKQHRSPGRLCARRHPQGDADPTTGVRRRPRAFAFVSMPLDMPQHPSLLHARSLRYNDLGPKGAAALAEGLKGNSTLQELE